MGKLLIKRAMVVPLHGDIPWFMGDIAVEDGIIKETGSGLGAKYPDYEVIDGRDSMVMPGFVNCHTHAAMTLLRGYADDLPLMEWLSKKIWPREAHLTAEDVYWGTLLSILEMIKGGTTCFADMYFFMDKVAQAVSETGIRAVLARGMVGLGEKAALALRESEEFVKTWHNQAEGRITCLLGPHAPYTCPPDYLKEVMRLSDDLGVGLHIHLAETQSEVEEMKEKYNRRPVELMNSIGLFAGRHVLAAHCVHLSEEEMELLACYRVGIAHNPESNMKLASGVAPVPELLAKNALVGLGTDGASSNNNLDMLEEMRSCAFLHKVSALDSTVLPSYEVLEMATRNGALALGLEDVGAIKEGCRADLIMLDLNKPHLIPRHDPIANLVYAAQSSDVKTVIIDGRVVMKEREILAFDEERIMYEAARIGLELAKRGGED